MNKKLVWSLIIGVSTLILHFLFFYNPELTEELYHNIIFKGIRVCYDYSIGFLPFPSFYLFIVYVGFSVFRFMKGVFLVVKGYSKKRLISFLSSLLLYIVLMISFFYMSWGFNYARPTFKDQLDFPTVPVDSMIVAAETRYIMSRMTTIRNQISDDDKSLDRSFLPDQLEIESRAGIEQVISNLGKETIGRGRVRILKPEGVLMRFSTAGIYMPYAFEGQIDAGLHPLQYPFVMAHEMGHVYGYAEEGTCNFIGYLACMQSEELFVQYSGMLGYWRYLISNLRKTAPHTYQKIRKEITPALRNDLDAIYDQGDKFPDILPKLRNQVYHSYLQSNGIKDGINNYNLIVQLTQQWKASGKHPYLLSKIYGDSVDNGN